VPRLDCERELAKDFFSGRSVPKSDILKLNFPLLGPRLGRLYSFRNLLRNGFETQDPLHGHHLSLNLAELEQSIGRVHL